MMASSSHILLIIFMFCTTWIMRESHSLHIPRMVAPFNTKEKVILDPKKRPFCNAFTGCGKKRSNLPALTEQGEEIEDSINSLLELSQEPAVEDLSRQIMSEAKLWEAIQEANMELNRQRSKQQKHDGGIDLDEMQQDDASVLSSNNNFPVGSCILPPCYI